MSAKIMGDVWGLELPREQKYVLVALADHADHEGNHVHPSAGLIAWKTEYEERNVRRIMAELETKGLIIPTNRMNGFVTEYRIELSHAPRKAPRTEKRGRPVKRANSPQAETDPAPDTNANANDTNANNDAISGEKTPDISSTDNTKTPDISAENPGHFYTPTPDIFNKPPDIFAPPYKDTRARLNLYPSYEPSYEPEEYAQDAPAPAHSSLCAPPPQKAQEQDAQAQDAETGESACNSFPQLPPSLQATHLFEAGELFEAGGLFGDEIGECDTPPKPAPSSAEMPAPPSAEPSALPARADRAKRTAPKHTPGDYDHPAMTRFSAMYLRQRGLDERPARMPSRDLKLETRAARLFDEHGPAAYERALQNYFSCLNGEDSYPKRQGYDLTTFCRQFDHWEGWSAGGSHGPARAPTRASFPAARSQPRNSPPTRNAPLGNAGGGSQYLSAAQQLETQQREAEQADTQPQERDSL